jgi:hypothetical protein
MLTRFLELTFPSVVAQFNASHLTTRGSCRSSAARRQERVQPQEFILPQLNGECAVFYAPAALHHLTADMELESVVDLDEDDAYAWFKKCLDDESFHPLLSPQAQQQPAERAVQEAAA